jgi:TRAP-type mannitol/chloroaromatic compound transport system permease small subunit
MTFTQDTETGGRWRHAARIAAAIDMLSSGLGRVLAWLVPMMVALVFALVLARYAFGIGSIAGQEAVLWLHGVVFMLGMAVALRHGRHVRVDVLQQRWSPRIRAWIEVGGCLLLLLPFAGFLVWISLDYVAASWAMREGSREPGGLPAVYLLKAVIPLAAGLLFLQGIAELLRACTRIFSRDPALRAQVEPEQGEPETAPGADRISRNRL